MSEIKNNLQFKDDKLHLEDEVVMKKVSGTPVNQEDETGTIDVDANINIGGSASINGDATVKGSVTIEGTSYKVIENPEYVWAIIDNDNKIICGIRTDGKFVADIDGIDEKIQEAINQMQTIIDEAQASIAEKIAAIDEKFDFISWIEDPEGRSEITTDAEDKIISYRDADGRLVENVGINFSEEGFADFAKNMKAKGFGIACDFSDYISNDGASPLHLPEPRCAIINFISNLPLPTSKNQDIRGYIEYNDMQGNYFKKKVIMNGQGSSSLAYNNQKNIAIDLFDNEWGDEAFALKIGNWVPQNSFHIKSFYMDPVRGLADVCYKYAEYDIEKTNTRPTRLIVDSELTTVHSDTGDVKKDYDTGALCHPDGFPCLLYHNGKFMGIYAWNLKKHRDNYLMDKKDYESVHVDAAYCNLWNLNPINWSGLEVRNPKTLICMDGSKYDGDSPKELIDSSSEYWTASKDQKNTVKTKNIIVGLHNKIAEINAATTTVEKKELFEQTFDVESFIVFWLISQLYDNWDGLKDRNTQWLYYKKTGKWCPTLYDLDNCIGYCGAPWLDAPITSLVLSSEYGENFTFNWLWELYKDRIVEVYTSLREEGIISSDAFMKYYNDWCSRLDVSYIKTNAKLWDVPCYRDGKVNSEYWKQIGIDYRGQANYDPNAEYSVGDVVNFGPATYIGGEYIVIFECIKACQGETPCGSYPNMPQLGGCFDSPRRIKKWLDAKIEILDNLIK